MTPRQIRDFGARLEGNDLGLKSLCTECTHQLQSSRCSITVNGSAQTFRLSATTSDAASAGDAGRWPCGADSPSHGVARGLRRADNTFLQTSGCLLGPRCRHRRSSESSRQPCLQGLHIRSNPSTPGGRTQTSGASVLSARHGTPRARAPRRFYDNIKSSY